MPFSLKSSQSQREIFHRGPLATLSLNLMSFLGHILPALPCVTSILRMCLCADIDKMAFYNHSHHTYTHKRLVLSTFLILCQCFKYSNAAHCEPFLLNTPICLHGVCGMLAVIKVEDILSPDYRRKKTEHTINTTKNIAMTDCLVILYPARRQSVIAILSLYLWNARLFLFNELKRNTINTKQQSILLFFR